MDLSAPDLSEAPASSTTFDTVLRIGLVAVLVYACARIVLPFAFVLMWSAILAVILYPLHLRLAGRLGDRGAALLIGLIGVAVILDGFKRSSQHLFCCPPAATRQAPRQGFSSSASFSALS